MPRAHRHFLPSHIWHITHRCHKKEYLLKFARDRSNWLTWLFEAKKRYGLCVLNYIVTSNHIHLLVHDQGKNEIPQSMQLIAGRVAQDYNIRKNRKGAFWEDRYHATAIATDDHLARCLTYIDLNMVRAGVVSSPDDWPDSGYAELRNDKQRYILTDIPALLDLLGLKDKSELQKQRVLWAAEELQKDQLKREPLWSDSLAVGPEDYLIEVKKELGYAARYRKIEMNDCRFTLKEQDAIYTPK